MKDEGVCIRTFREKMESLPSLNQRSHWDDMLAGTFLQTRNVQMYFLSCFNICKLETAWYF